MKGSYKVLGENLKKARLDRGLTLEEVGDILFVKKSTIMRWENGQTKKVSIANLEKLSAVYGVSIDYLIERSDEDFSPNAMDYKIEYRPAAKILRAYSGDYYSSSYDDSAMIPQNILDDPERYFFVRIQDDSMSPKIMINDLVLVQKCDKIKNGDAALVSVNFGERILRRVIFTNETITLICENGSFKPQIFYGEERSFVKIYGKAVKLIRDIEF